jgi:hypothetical protein
MVVRSEMLIIKYNRMCTTGKPVPTCALVLEYVTLKTARCSDFTT